MQETNRKFKFGKLEIRKFIISDYLYLISYLLAVLYYLYSSKYNPEYKLGISLIISFAAGFQTISSPFGLRFRNIYFSIIWLILSLLLLIDNYFFSLIPLSTFILYHVIRILFWKKNNREFIPYQSGKGQMFRFKSYFEGQYGNLTDKKYTKILLGIGILIIGCCLIQMIVFKN
jgi:hypothetical protein